MTPIPRRTCLRQLALAFPAVAFLPRSARAEPHEPDGSQKLELERIARKFMEAYRVPGFSVAFSSAGKVVHRAAYGLADVDANEELTPEHRFRIASISKPVTAAAIFALVEQGKLKENDRVFGKGGVLSAMVKGDLPPRVKDVTISHLLTHTSGGWGNQRNDPMFGTPDLDHADLIRRTVKEQPLENDPGTSYSYSNFGYCVLGRVIEKVSRKSYETYVKSSVLEPCGIRSMEIAGDTLDDRLPGEVVYHSHEGENPYNMKVRRMDAHGGWLASASDLVAFLMRYDGRRDVPDLLKDATRMKMLAGTTANPGYASGWCVNATPNHWHNGSLPGTATIAVSTASGMSWAGLTNLRAPGISPAQDAVMWEMAKAVPEWRA